MNSELPLNLYKAHAGLQLHVTRAWQEANHRWLEAARQLSAQGIAETALQIQGLLNTADWPTATTVPTQVLWRLLQGGLTDAQSVSQLAMKNQAALVDGLRQALAEWQEALAKAFGVEVDSSALGRLCAQWVRPWTVAEASAGVTPQAPAQP